MAYQNREQSSNKRDMVPRNPGVQRKNMLPGEPALDYKDLETLRRFVTSSQKLMSRKRTGMTAQEQSQLKDAVKQARFIALLPFTGTHH